MKRSPALPIAETTLAILISVSDQPRHGYAIMKWVETFSSGRIRLSTGTLYGALKRLLECGWVARVDTKDAQTREGGRERKAYTLTTAGRQAVSAEAARLRQLATAAEAFLGPGVREPAT